MISDAPAKSHESPRQGIGALADFIMWLGAYGETSWDYQSFFAGPVGGQPKRSIIECDLLGLLPSLP